MSGFRLFKPTYVRPLPQKPKIVAGKLCLTEGGKTVRHKLTKDGAGYLCPTEAWYVEFKDHKDRPCRLPAFTSERGLPGRSTHHFTAGSIACPKRHGSGW